MDNDTNDSLAADGVPAVCTIADAAAALRLSEARVRKLLRDGELAGIKTGGHGGRWRIERRAIAEYLTGGDE